MAFKVLRSRQCDRDLELIFDHLVESYHAIGDDMADALERAAERIGQIETSMARLATAPFQGALRPDIMHGLGNVTKANAVIYFTVNEDKEEIRILALFFGGQDHQRHMLKRMIQDI